MVGEVRHACQGCGGSCRGVNVRPVDDAEAARVVAVAAQLGVSEPLVDGRLRRVDGGCVFLAGDRCRIHAEIGPDAKPTICSQYPLVAVQTEAGVRWGVDPGCYRHASTWRTGPEVRPGAVRASRAVWSPPQAAMEADVLARLDAPTLAEALRRVVDGRGDEVPVAFLHEAARRVAGLRGALAEEGAGPAMRTALAPVLAGTTGLLSGTAHAWRVDAQDEAYALDATRRAVRLRLLLHLGSPYNAAFLVLSGAVVAGFAAPGGVGPALAAWTRGLRAGPFVRALVGDGLEPWVASARG